MPPWCPHRDTSKPAFETAARRVRAPCARASRVNSVIASLTHRGCRKIAPLVKQLGLTDSRPQAQCGSQQPPRLLVPLPAR